MLKKEIEQMLDIVTSFIKELTDEQYHNLLSGKASLQYVASSGDSEFDLMAEKIRQEVVSAKDIGKVMGNPVKKDLLAFCKHEGISTTSKDTKALLYEKIAVHFQVATQNVEAEKNEVDPIHRIAQELREINALEEAKEFLSNHRLLRTKKDLLKLAKSLHVHVNQNTSKKELLNRTVESVVGAKIRGKVIRGEL